MGTTISSKDKKLNKVLSIIAWLFIGIGSIAVVWFYLFSSSHVTTNDAQVKQYITPVSSKISGYIQEVRFKENQEVKKGDTLVIIDNREFKNQVDAAQAHLQSTTATIATVENAAITTSSNTAIINAQIDAATVDVSRMEKEYVRYKNLILDEAATQQQFEAIEAEYKKAKAKLSALEKERTTINLGVTTEQSKVIPVRSEVNREKANVNNAQLTLSYSYVLAPYDGWVGVKNIQPGQYVQAGQALVQVVSKEKWIVANFKETQLGAIDETKFIDIKVDAYPNIDFKGKMESISPGSGSEFSLIKPDYATGNFVKIEQRFPVRIMLVASPSNGLLRTGMNVTIAAEKK